MTTTHEIRTRLLGQIQDAESQLANAQATYDGIHAEEQKLQEQSSKAYVRVVDYQEKLDALKIRLLDELDMAPPTGRSPK